MSLEESMKELAESNRELAASMKLYAGVMSNIASKNPDHIVTPPATEAATTTADAPKTGKGGRKSQAAKDEAAKADVKAQAGDADPFADGSPDDADPFADSSEAAVSAPKLTAEAIRGLVIRVKSEKGDDAAMKVLAHVGVKTLGQIKEDDYQKVVDFCARGGIKL